MTQTTSTGGDATQAGAGRPSDAGPAGTPETTTTPATPAETAISDQWARRRLEIYGALERALHEGIAQALKTVVDVRGEVEQDAETFLAGLAAERARRQRDLDELGAQREGAEARLVARRQEIDAELAARRRDQEQAIEARRHDQEQAIETRRREQEADLEARRLEQEEELRVLRQTAEEEVATLRSTTQAEIERMVQEAETRRAQVAAEVRTLEQQVAQIQGVIDSFLDNQLQTLRGSLGSTRTRPSDTRGDARGGLPGGGGGVSAGQGNGGEPGTGGEPAGGGDEGGLGGATEGWPPADTSGAGQRTSLVISGVPHFSRARALWQAIQDLPGVAEAKTLSYQGGTLSMEVQHEPTLDLSASVVDLPGLRLHVAEASPGQLRLAAEV